MTLRCSVPLVVAAALAAACAARPPASATADAPADWGARGAAPDGGQWLQQACAKAHTAGAGECDVLAVDAGAPGDRIGRLLAVPDDSCALLLARASPSVEDADLFAYADDGTVLGSDEQPDRTPALLICPPHPARMFVVARVAAGHGIVALGAQRVEPTDADAVARAVGMARRSRRDAGRFSTWPGLDEKVAARRRALGSSWQDVRRVGIPVDPRMPTRLSARVEPDRCLDVLAVPAEGVGHLDMAVRGRDGRVLGRAGGHGRDRAIVVCSPTPTPVTVELRPHVGEGLVAIVLSRSAAGAATQLGADALVYDVAPTVKLDVARRRHAAVLKRTGYRRGKLAAQGTLEVGRRASVPLSLPAGCVRIDLVIGRPARGVDAWLWAADGALVARDHATGHATLFACGPARQVRLDAEALVLPGPFAVEVRDEHGTPDVLERHPLAAARLLSRMIATGVLRRASEVGTADVVRVTPTRLEQTRFLVPVGRCIDLTLALGPGAAGAEVRLVDEQSDAELAQGHGTHSACARACALRRGDTLRVRAELRCALGQTDGLVATRMLMPRP